MEIFDLFVPSNNKLLNDYYSQNIDVFQFFDYDIHSPLVFEMRRKDVTSRTFQREELTQHLEEFNSLYNCHENTLHNIQRLVDPNSVVVIGGQQAGILTGPLYTIHKIISIIKLAKQQEEQLGIPVIPVFWIAGEDHDFAEINHLFVKEKEGIKKKAVPQAHLTKSMVSTITIDKERTSGWLTEVFETFGETDQTNDLLHLLQKLLLNSETYIDFFARIIQELFYESGLVLVDSGSAKMRKLESNFFKNIIDNNKEIHDALLEQQKIIEAHQYKKTIEMNENSANLFYHLNGERVLLEYSPEHDIFRGKNNECILCKDELMETAESHPENLSNNVVTRPLMQEFLFPTLAFISGPGEVSYWAELKKAFGVMGIKMPPVVPRLMMTIVERSIETCVEDVGLTIAGALSGEAKEMKRVLVQKQTASVDEKIVYAKQEVEQIHKSIRNMALEVDKGLFDILLRNAENVQAQFDFLKNTINKRILLQNEIELKKFSRIESSLLPLDSPQERIWNIFYYLNKYGIDFASKLVDLPYEFNGKHKIIKV